MLRKEILRVSGSKSVWESKVAWRSKPLDQLNPPFQAQVLFRSYHESYNEHSITLRCFA